MRPASWVLLSILGASALMCAPAAAQVAEETPPTVTAAPVVAPALPPAPTIESPPTPPPAEPGVASPGGALTLHLRSNQPGVSFHYAKLARPDIGYTPTDWTRACLEECNVRLLPGAYRFALSNGAGEPVLAPRMFEASSGARLEGMYTDHSTTRLAGVLVLAIGGVSSLATATTGGVLANTWGSEDIGTATLVGGIVGTLLSLAIGIPLAATSDEVRVSPSGAAP